MGLSDFFKRKAPDRYPPLEEELWLEASRDRPALRSLSPEDALRLRAYAAWFRDTRDWRPAGGAEPGPGDLAAISLLACLPILGLGPSWYRGWSTVVLTEDSFSARMSTVDRAGVVTEYDDELAGRATELGPVVLSLRDARESGLGDGFDVVIHEMAHKLDELDGELNGCPPLPRSVRASEWRDAFSAAYADFAERAGRPSRRRRGPSSRLPLDEYAAESPDEFFAVACEHFFHTPGRLRLAYPEVHRLLSAFFAGR